jgi:predicted DNA binding CopG/RHH family protein
MTQPEPKKSRIPEFASREEEAEWFDTHDLGDYLDEFEVVDSRDVRVASNLSTGITVRLTPALLRQLRRTARAKGIGPSTLARMWIVEHLRESEGNERPRTP